MNSLRQWGWSDFFSGQVQDWSEELVPARVVEQHRTEWLLISEQGERRAELSGRLRHEIEAGARAPAVGDWVLCEERSAEGRATVRRILKRKTEFVRKAAGQSQGQVVAANLDTVLLLAALDGDYNPRRLERYLTLAWESGAQPVVALTKADLAPDPESWIERTRALAPGAPVLALSARTGAGLPALEPFFLPGRTVALLGSSGVGKSTLVNALLGFERQRVNTVGDDGTGRHTTTARELIQLPGGALILDTPGMRELGLWAEADSADGSGLQRTFEDLEGLAAGCRFKDCRHAAEPGCAVRQAIESGALEPGRLASYRKLERERAFEFRKSDPQALSNAKRRWKKMSVRNNERHRQKEYLD